MSRRLRDLHWAELGALRHEPIDKRIRATLGGRTVVDTTRALLVWEPRRIVPSYAAPAEDVAAQVAPAPPGAPAAAEGPMLGERRVLDPSVPFAVHTAEGEPLALAGPGGRSAAAFRPVDPDLAGYLVLDFVGFDEWYEEDERNHTHPRDPFHRIDILRSSRRVRVELGGVVLAESSRPTLLFEPPLPVRYYLPPDDVRMDLLRPSPSRTSCAYKGRASYRSAAGEDDIAWTYAEPLREAAEVAGLVAFFNERVDLAVDGVAQERPVTPWSRRGS